MKILVKIVLGLFLSLSFVAPVFAIAIIDFGTGDVGAGGTITIFDDGSVLGVGIPLDSLTVNGTAKDGVYDLSGTATSQNPDDGLSASLNFATGGKAGDNSITIEGYVSGLDIDVSTVLLSGTFSSFSVTDTGFVGGLINGSGTDTKALALLEALGITFNQWDFFGFTMGFNTDGSGSPYNATSTDFINTQVPEPATMLLLGSGLIGLAAYARRRFKK